MRRPAGAPPTPTRMLSSVRVSMDVCIFTITACDKGTADQGAGQKKNSPPPGHMASEGLPTARMWVVLSRETRTVRCVEKELTPNILCSLEGRPAGGRPSRVKCTVAERCGWSDRVHAHCPAVSEQINRTGRERVQCRDR
jgi:hypothetical protein